MVVAYGGLWFFHCWNAGDKIRRCLSTLGENSLKNAKQEYQGTGKFSEKMPETVFIFGELVSGQCNLGKMKNAPLVIG